LLFAQAETSGAEDSNKETLVTFSSPVEAPGILLPAGAYVFKLTGADTDHVVVQVFDAGEGAPLAEFNTIPVSRAEATEESVVTFAEHAEGRPAALRQLFYPGETEGVEFVYEEQTPQQTVDDDGDEEDEPAAVEESSTRFSKDRPFYVILIPLPDQDESGASYY
jgi:hypothetical protein